MREDKIPLVQKSGPRRLQRFDAIQAETPFLLLAQEDKRRHLLAGCEGIVNIKIVLSYIKANEMHENFSFDMNLNLLM